MLLQVVASTRRRGAEVFASQLGTELERRSTVVRTVALSGGGSPALDLPVLGAGRWWSAVGELRRQLIGADLAIAHGSTTLPACALATARMPVPFVYRSIGEPAWWASGRLRRARTRLLLSRARDVVALWPDAADQLVRLHGLSPRRVHVIPNGVPSEAFPPVTPTMRAAARQRLGVPSDVPVAVYLGALSTEKNVGATVEAIAGLPGVHLVLAGDGPLRDEIARLLVDRLPGRHTLLGSTADPAGVLATADVVVLSSWTEGCPGVLIEAGMSGIPVVATKVGGVAHIVVDGETGVLVEAGDVRSMTAAVKDVLDDPGPLGRAARARCLRQFDLAVVGRAWDELVTGVTA